MQVSLVMFKADGSRRDFPVTKDRTVVGRKNNCDLRIPLSSVSRQHCEFLLDQGELRLRDLGSSNGTYHNGIRVQEATVSAGDEVTIGPVEFIVVIDGEPAEIPPRQSTVTADDDDDDAGQSPSMPTMVPQTDAAPAEPTDEDGDGDDDDLLRRIASPTVDLDDDDPIAALERMAEAEGLGGTSSGEFELDHDDESDDPRQS